MMDAEPMNPYCSVELRPAENGFILRYCEKTQTGNSPYDYTTKNCEEIFSFEDGMKALDRMKELYGNENES